MLGALYASVLFFAVINALIVQPVLSAERAVSYRERAAGMYSFWPWTLALVSTLKPTNSVCVYIPLHALFIVLIHGARKSSALQSVKTVTHYTV